MPEVRDEIRTFWLDESQGKKAAGLLSAGAAGAVEKGYTFPVVCAVSGNKVIGALAGAVNNDEFEIDSIYVDPEYRRLGAGKKMMEELYSLLQDMDLSVSIEYTLTEEGEETGTLRPFLYSMGFHEEEEFYPSYLTGSLNDLEVDVKSAGVDFDDIRSLEDMKGKIPQQAEDSDPFPLLLPEGVFSLMSVDRTASFLALKDNLVTAYAVVRIMENDIVRIDMDGVNGLEAGEVRIVLSYAEKKLKSKYGSDHTVCMLSSTAEAERVISRVLKGCTRVSYRFVNLFPGVI